MSATAPGGLRRWGQAGRGAGSGAGGSLPTRWGAEVRALLADGEWHAYWQVRQVAAPYIEPWRAVRARQTYTRLTERECEEAWRRDPAALVHAGCDVLLRRLLVGLKARRRHGAGGVEYCTAPLEAGAR